MSVNFLGDLHMETEGVKQKKICIVDDDPDLREIYGTVFRREGFEVFLAENGEVGLRVIQTERPDIIILDLQMPVKDGFEVLQELKVDDELSKIPVIILSNVDNEVAFREAEGAHSYYYLLKVLTTPQKAVDIACEVLQDKSEN